jgi:hypothetical protein
MLSLIRQQWITCCAVLVFALPAAAQSGRGLKVSRSDVLFGNSLTTSAPAEVDLAECVAATPEGQTIEREGVEKGSARYSILIAKAQSRVRSVVATVAAAESRDCVVKKDSYRNPAGLEVVPLTSQVVAALSRGEGDQGGCRRD